MNVLSSIRRLRAENTKLNKTIESFNKASDKEIRELENEKSDELRTVRDKWDILIDKKHKEATGAITPIKTEIERNGEALTEMRDRLFITRVATQGNVYSQSLPGKEKLLDSMTLNFMVVRFFEKTYVIFTMDPPNYRRRKVELIVKVHAGKLEGIIRKRLNTKWDGTILSKRFDTEEELTAYLVKNKDKITKPIYETDNWLADIAMDPDYRKAAIEDYDMTMVWQEWATESIDSISGSSVKVTFTDYGRADVEVEVKHLEGNKFTVKILKGDSGPVVIAKILERVKDHLNNGIYFCNNPELIR